MQITDFRFETKSTGQVKNAFSYHIKCKGGVKFETPAQHVQNQSVRQPASHADNSDMV